MTNFRVTLSLSQEDLMHLIRSGELVGATITPIAEPADNTPLAVRMPHKTRAVRGSKVNDAILGALADGPQSAKTLKAALEKAGLAGGSLSTGLALLQKAHRVERVGDGSYAMTMQKAAE